MGKAIMKSSSLKRLIRCALLILALVLLVRYAPTNVLKPADSAFSLSATDTPQTMKVGETVQVEATLQYAPFRSFVADTGNKAVFITFVHEDDPTPVYAGVGKYSYLPAGGQTSLSKTLSPTKPGTYTLEITAEFYIGDRYYRQTLPVRTIIVSK